MAGEDTSKLIELAHSLVSEATKKGADVAEAVARDGSELSAKVRRGKPELVQEASSRAVGLRVIKDGKEATAYTSDMTTHGLSTLVDDAISLAELSQVDELSGPPDPSLLCASFEDLELYDGSVTSILADKAIDIAKQGEDHAFALDPRITNSEGSTFSRNAGGRALVTSAGFSGAYSSSSVSLVVSPVADDADGKKQNGHFWDAKRSLGALLGAKEVGEEAARRTLAKLGASKVPTCEVPVVFDKDAGRALLSLLFSCVNGGAVYRKSSYLADREGDQIASSLVQVVDDPLIPKAPGSRPFDGEGLASKKNVVVEDGVLKTFLLDTYSARKLGKESTASAARGLGGRPSPSASNFLMLPTDTKPEAILKEVDKGLYVTSMMGFGFNPVTGDFSRGAEGFWIENGEKTFPVSGITIGLNFDELLKRIDAIGDDLEHKTSIACPTFRVSRMTVSGT